MPKLPFLPLLAGLLAAGLTAGCEKKEPKPATSDPSAEQQQNPVVESERDPVKVQRINKKLDDIVFPEFTAPGIPLPDLVKAVLEPGTRKYDLAESDPAKKGLNYIINNVAFDYISLKAAPAASPSPLLDLKGNPITAGADGVQKPDLDTVLIKLESMLRGLTLRQVLDVICKTAEVRMPDGRPAGLKYVVEEYGIAFYPIFPALPPR